MKRFLKTGMAILLAMVLGFSSTQAAFAEEIKCRGTMGAVTVDNLRVPQNGTCNLDGTTIKGTLYVSNGATLTAKNITVNGNIQAEGAAKVNVTGSEVGGSVQIKQGGSAKIHKVSINGDLQFFSNTKALVATYNTIGGNIQAFQNMGGLSISYNTVDGNLQCKSNSPRPVGTQNVVYGSKTGQCSKL